MIRIGDIVTAPGGEGVGRVKAIQGAAVTVMLDTQTNLVKKYFLAAVKKAPLSEAAQWEELNG